MRRGGGTFGLRLLVAIVLTLAAVGVVGYLLIAHEQRREQIANYARAHEADVASLERAGDSPQTVAHLIQAMGDRPGTLESLLIDRRSLVIASGDGQDAVGERDSDPRIVSALEHGRSYAGLEADPEADGRDFEFVAPVRLPGGRHALEVTYDHRFFDANLHAIRRTLALVGLLALVGGTGVFYLVGGRVLLRSHRIALERATRDGLTDLPNHRAFQDELPHAVAAADRYRQPLALIVFDLDDFKHLNDHFGHPHGDAVLRRVGDVLRAGRGEDRAHRIGGDEFAMLLPHTDGEGARRIAARLHQAFAAAEVVVSMGISDLREGRSGDDLRAEADAALYEAKRRGEHGAVHFDEIRDSVTITTSGRTDLVRRLIDERLLSTVYQPIWDLETGAVLAVEALMRPDADVALSGPAEAFDLAEQIGRVRELDLLCVERALAELPPLGDDALLFLNLSPHSLDAGLDAATWLLDAVRGAGLAPERVVVEVTERSGARTDLVVASLGRLREVGFRIALDDVGTGNAGLDMLRRVNADYVKIDRSIVLAASTDRSARAVLMAMATYARQTGSYVIAEGIEDQETFDFLAGIGDPDPRPGRIIQGGQGFGLARPAKTPDARWILSPSWA